MSGNVTVTGADTPEVTIVSNLKNKHAEEKRADGLRRLDSEVTYSVAENDNVITLVYGSDLRGPAPAGATVALTVPRNTSIIVSNSFGGKITVKDIVGDVEVHNMNGKITLDHVSGGATVETMNGEVQATFAKVPADKPLSFTSMNGEIDVSVPADTKANVRLRTQNGAIYTDFDEKALVTKTEAANVPPLAASRARRPARRAPTTSGRATCTTPSVRPPQPASRPCAKPGRGPGSRRSRPGRRRRGGRPAGAAHAPRAGGAARVVRWQGRQRHAQRRRPGNPDRHHERHHHAAQRAAVNPGRGAARPIPPR